MDSTVAHIALYGNRIVLIDAVDFEVVAQWRWSFDGKYATRKPGRKGRKIYLHRFIMNAMPGVEIDHINGDKLDNRRCNLRITTRQQNSLNARGKGGTSQFKGVAWDKANQKWMANIMINGRNHRIGRFRDELEAARAYNDAARELHGEYARLNEVTP